MGTEQEHANNDSQEVTGIYLRTLDTCPSAMVTFSHRVVGFVDDMQLPISVTHSDEYVRRLLSKSSKNPFHIKLSRSKGFKVHKV